MLFGKLKYLGATLLDKLFAGVRNEVNQEVLFDPLGADWLYIRGDVHHSFMASNIHHCQMLATFKISTQSFQVLPIC